ncbi:hypothetical protein MRB53_039746 [Persea americana]|nr:hypothetical protein MRB53_039746 [Persea americana]
MAITTALFWPLPLLHGRKPYTVAAFAVMLPLQYPQALAVETFHNPDSVIARVGLLLPRILTGLAMGFGNVNFLPTLLDLFGASLMSDNPHQEHVQEDDVRRQGGGIGLWLGIWTWCYIGSLSIGFCVGACIISKLNSVWGFWLVTILLAVFLVINIIAPETRQAPYRHTVIHFLDQTLDLRRRVGKGELLGALLSREYQWSSDLVGAASLSLAIGAFLAIPLTHGNIFSRSRIQPPRRDSMTFHRGSISWTSHMIRRCIFTLILPLAGLAYTLASPGDHVSWTVPVIFVGLVGFLSNLAITECIGLMMETFDTCDLQAGANICHREMSMPEAIRRVRTHYSSFPRVCAGFFSAQSLGFLLAAAATGVSGTVTRALGAQISSAGVAGILLILTILLLGILIRWRSTQVIPDNLLGTMHMGKTWAELGSKDEDWMPVVLGNPSGKLRRTNMLEMGNMSRWSEIRRLNGLAK